MNSTKSKSPSLTFTHHWTLDNFSHLYDENCGWKWSVESETFTVPENEDLKFSLRIWPKEKGRDGVEYLGVALVAQEIPDMWEGKVTVKERRCIVNEEGKILFSENYVEREVFENRWVSDAEYLRVKELLDPSRGYLQSGTLRVLCEMTLHFPEAIFTLPVNAHTFSHTSIPSFVSSFSHSLTLSHFKWLCEDSTREMPLRVESGYFAPQREDIGRMRLGFFPKTDKGNDEENVDIVIQNFNTDSLNAHFECSLLDAKGDKCHQDEETCLFLPNRGAFFSFPRHRLLSLLDSLPTDKLTIKCHVTVWGKEAFPTTPTTSTTHFDFALFTFHYVPFTWTIERFLAQLNRHFIDSKSFSPSTDSRYAFHLRLFPKKDSENVTLTLCFTPTYSFEESTVNWRFSVMDALEKEWNCIVGSELISKPAQFGPYKLMPHRTLTNFASLLLAEGKLTIKCELWIHEPRKELPPELRTPPPQARDSAAPQVYISNSQFINSILASQSTITARNINNTSSSTTDEFSKPK